MYITLKQFATQIGVDRHTAAKLIRNKQVIGAVKTGSRYYIPDNATIIPDNPDTTQPDTPKELTIRQHLDLLATGELSINQAEQTIKVITAMRNAGAVASINGKLCTLKELEEREAAVNGDIDALKQELETGVKANEYARAILEDVAVVVNEYRNTLKGEARKVRAVAKCLLNYAKTIGNIKGWPDDIELEELRSWDNMKLPMPKELKEFDTRAMFDKADEEDE